MTFDIFMSLGGLLWNVAGRIDPHLSSLSYSLDFM